MLGRSPWMGSEIRNAHTDARDVHVRWSPLCIVGSRTGGMLLHHPTVAVGIVEEDERVPVTPAAINQDGAFVVLDGANLHPPLDQLAPGSLNPGHNEL